MEKSAVLIFCNVFLLPGVGIAIALLCGHGADLIAGFNTASPEEKAKWNKQALCRGVGAILLLGMLLIELTVVGGALGLMPLVWIPLALFFVVIVLGVVWINRDRRFRK